jgi:hypothetical protein
MSVLIPTNRTPSSTRAPTGISIGPVRSDVGVRRVRHRACERASSRDKADMGDASANGGSLKGESV